MKGKFYLSFILHRSIDAMTNHVKVVSEKSGKDLKKTVLFDLAIIAILVIAVLLIMWGFGEFIIKKLVMLK